MIGSARSFERSRGLSHGAVRRAIQSGRLRRALRRDGRIDFEKADAELAANTRPAAPRMSLRNGSGNGRVESDTMLAFASARALREHFAALRAKADFEREEGKLVEASEIRAGVFVAMKAAREVLLSMEDRLCAVLPGLPVEEQRRAIAREIERVMSEIGKLGHVVRAAFPAEPAS